MKKVRSHQFISEITEFEPPRLLFVALRPKFRVFTQDRWSDQTEMTADVTVTPDIILKSYQLDIYYPLQEHM
jgi:hypothetical protein